jgi:hypothetical protein
MIVAGTMKHLQFIDFGAPLHCSVITSKPVEEEMLILGNFIGLLSRILSTAATRRVFGSPIKGDSTFYVVLFLENIRKVLYLNIL